MPRKKKGNERAEAMRILANAIIWLGGNGNGDYEGSNDCDAISKAFEAISASIKGFVVVRPEKTEGEEGQR